MKIILVSDPHLVAPGKTLFGMDPLRQLQGCIADINARHADADFVVFAGDLTNDGDGDAYAALVASLGALVPPHRLMAGNHDDRARLLAAFPDAEGDGGFIHCALDIGGKRVILLDTLWPGHVEGQLCEARLEWLDRQLDGVPDALVFLHHPPFPIGIASLDDCRLAAPERLLALLQRHGNVRHIFAGHVHRLSSGSWHGIPFSTVRGTSHQSALKFDGPHAVSFETPAYTVILDPEGALVVHTAEFAAG